ncbi:amidohydrolase family protein [Paraburkholderia sp. ZP32-5]|uniref:amidohydrolase family protein n=1 Tax=Paraburkholderia sp. ZP32-5 TaxID=2883245 RepID=UPI001F1ED278|nr:amidohydrolase family protein [Paraburkholderia sp. ZP32-5]
MSTQPHPRGFAELLAWQASRVEDVLDPELPVIDAHHHLWRRPPHTYLSDAFAEDIGSGHNIRATVFIECDAMYKPSGPPELRSLGETEFANGVAAMSLAGAFDGRQVCAGIVGRVELALGDAVRPLLEAHIVAGGGRFRGVRNHANYAPGVTIGARQAPAGVLLAKDFRRGFAHLAPLGLSYDSWQFFEQIPDLTDLARAFPDTRIILNHVGGILGIGPYRRENYFGAWRKMVAELATCPNVFMKLGGLGMETSGFDHFHRDAPVSSAELAADWQPYIDTCIEMFGTARCLFESNFPADKQCGSYRTLWNAFKRVAAGYSSTEKHDLFYGTAASAYRLEI